MEEQCDPHHTPNHLFHSNNQVWQMCWVWQLEIWGVARVLGMVSVGLTRVMGLVRVSVLGVVKVIARIGRVVGVD